MSRVLDLIGKLDACDFNISEIIREAKALIKHERDDFVAELKELVEIHKDSIAHLKKEYNRLTTLLEKYEPHYFDVKYKLDGAKQEYASQGRPEPIRYKYNPYEKCLNEKEFKLLGTYLQLREVRMPALKEELEDLARYKFVYDAVNYNGLEKSNIFTK